MGRLSGYAAGISQGLQNAATFQNIKSGMARDERAQKTGEQADVLFAQSQADRADAEKEMDINSWAAKMEGGPEAQKYITDFAGRLGYGENGKIKKKQAVEVVKALESNPNAQYRILQFKKKAVAGDIDNLSQEIQGLQEGGGGIAAIAPLSVQLRQKQD